MTERDEHGRFVKGVSGNPGGRPSRDARFLEITMETVTYASWKKIIKKAMDQAEKGNPTARKFLADYILGPPVQRQEVTGADGRDLIPDDDTKRQRDAALVSLATALSTTLSRTDTE